MKRKIVTKLHVIKDYKVKLLVNKEEKSKKAIVEIFS